jgi:hypothetical protein
VLQDHLDNTPDLTSSIISMPPELYDEYILSPRVSNEMKSGLHKLWGNESKRESPRIK